MCSPTPPTLLKCTLVYRALQLPNSAPMSIPRSPMFLALLAPFQEQEAEFFHVSCDQKPLKPRLPTSYGERKTGQGTFTCQWGLNRQRL